VSIQGASSNLSDRDGVYDRIKQTYFQTDILYSIPFKAG
jgi:hypothetical protein